MAAGPFVGWSARFRSFAIGLPVEEIGHEFKAGIDGGGVARENCCDDQNVLQGAPRELERGPGGSDPRRGEGSSATGGPEATLSCREVEHEKGSSVCCRVGVL